MKHDAEKARMVFLVVSTAIAFGCSDDSKPPATEANVDKQFKLTAEQIRPLAEGYGGCMATDMITVQGHRVNFMYRQASDREVDSGWRFMSGLESDEYMDEAANHGVYDVNTIANYDPEIVPYLDAPIGSAFERDQSTGQFVSVDFSAPDD